MYSNQEQSELKDLTQKLVKTPEELSNEKRAEALRRVLNYHDWRYYVLSEPVLQDFDYDKLFKDLRKLESENPTLVTPDSPTQRVARGLTDDFHSVSHLVSMLSLENSYNSEDIADFDKTVKKLTNVTDVEYCVEPKFDGSSIALVYENDILIRAATRGDGAVGEDITNNAKAL
ncbi:MAG: ligase LigA, partial [Bacteroidota bacterium]|nr:ligase LigA [Bacteroidota bacterium]